MPWTQKEQEQGAARPYWGYRGGTGGRAGVVKVSIHQIGPKAHGVGLLEPSHSGAHTRLQGELVPVRSSLPCFIRRASWFLE